MGLKTGSDGGESRLAAYVEVITSALGHAVHDLADALECAPSVFGLAVQIRRRRRSTSGTITAFACIRPGVSVDNPLAACLACCNPMAMWNQPAIRGVLRSASERIARKPEAPSVNGLGLAPAPRSLAYSLVRP